MKKFEQAWRIKRLLAESGETISSLSRKLNRPFGSVANNIYGYRAYDRLQGEIAAFLGRRWRNSLKMNFNPTGDDRVMADGRMLKKKISLNEAVADLANDSHRLLFTWGIAHLDVEGRITGSLRGRRIFVATVFNVKDFDKHFDPKRSYLSPSH